MKGLKNGNGDALRAQIAEEMADSFDEELELEFDDERLDKLLSEVEELEHRARRRDIVVDDETLVRMLLVDAVTEVGFAGLEAGDGAEALDILSSDATIDLLVTDIGLPGGMNGRQLADEARALRPGLKVLFVTGYAETAVQGDTDRLPPGMQIITKPFDIAALSIRIRDMIEG